MKVKNKINKNKKLTDEIIQEIGFDYLGPSDSFIRKLKKEFLEAAEQPKKYIDKSFSYFLRFFSVLVVFSLVLVIGLRINLNNNVELSANSFRDVYQNSSQSAMMPVFAKLRNLNSGEITSAMNISRIPLDKSNFGTSTTTKIFYGPAYESCANIFKFDKSISKTITFESYHQGIYKFKTHVFNQNNVEIELLLSDGENYFSQTSGQTYGSGSANISSINNFLPNNLETVQGQEISWYEQIDCNGKQFTLKNIIKYESANQTIKSFEIYNSSLNDYIYRAEFEIQPMTQAELKLVDSIFNTI